MKIWHAVVFLFAAAFGYKLNAARIETYRNVHLPRITYESPVGTRMIQYSYLTGFINNDFEAGRPTYLLIHGLGQSAGLLVDQAAFFASRGYNVLAIDMPGHGMRPMSEIGGNAWVGKQSVEDACDYLHVRNANEIYVYAFSNGATSAYAAGKHCHFSGMILDRMAAATIGDEMAPKTPTLLSKYISRIIYYEMMDTRLGTTQLWRTTAAMLELRPEAEIVMISSNIWTDEGERIKNVALGLYSKVIYEETPDHILADRKSLEMALGVLER